jgi:fructose-1,6-bisphosphatase
MHIIVKHAKICIKYDKNDIVCKKGKYALNMFKNIKEVYYERNPLKKF